MNIFYASSRLGLVPVALLMALRFSSSPLLASPATGGASLSQPKQLSMGERIAHQRAIEEVLWRNRIWPEVNPDPKPSLDEIMSPAEIEEKVSDYMRNSQALEDRWHQPITRAQLQSEMDRMARETSQPRVLRELFATLENDPVVIAECLARPVLAARLIMDRIERPTIEASVALHDSHEMGPFVLPVISDPDIVSDYWTPTATLPSSAARTDHTATWTGSEMIIWGGFDGHGSANNGWRYYPSTNSWAPTTLANAPQPREAHTAVWTGSEMIVWGGDGSCCTAGRYNPAADHWKNVAYQNSPSRRYFHTAVWTGTEMIVWGGCEVFNFNLNTGGRYSPRTDTWRPTSMINVPTKRVNHTAVWTGREMIIWSGQNPHVPGGDPDPGNTGGKYDPVTDTWTPTSTNGAPEGRFQHTAVWTGHEMIVWGGHTDLGYEFSSGAKYDPANDSWIITTDTNCPDNRTYHSAVWTGSEMIIWGGNFYKDSFHELNSGARYDPNNNSWITTTRTNAPVGRDRATAIWAGDRRMIVWGGEDGTNYLSSGGVYRLP